MSAYCLTVSRFAWSYHRRRSKHIVAYVLCSRYAYCSLDKGVACAQHIQLPTHTSVSAWYECT